VISICSWHVKTLVVDLYLINMMMFSRVISSACDIDLKVGVFSLENNVYIQ